MNYFSRHNWLSYETNREAIDQLGEELEFLKVQLFFVPLSENYKQSCCIWSEPFFRGSLGRQPRGEVGRSAGPLFAIVFAQIGARTVSSVNSWVNSWQNTPFQEEKSLYTSISDK
jgi:hypothetical protein